MATMLLTIKGTPIIYMGEELGMLNSKIPSALRMDPIAHAKFPVTLFQRDGERTPMEWNNQKNRGFSQGEKTWLPVGNNVSVEDQEKDQESVLNFYKQLISCRNSELAL